MEITYTVLIDFTEEENDKVTKIAEARGLTTEEYLSKCIDAYGKYLTLEEDFNKCMEIIDKIDDPDKAEYISAMNRIKTLFESEEE